MKIRMSLWVLYICLISVETMNENKESIVNFGAFNTREASYVVDYTPFTAKTLYDAILPYSFISVTGLHLTGKSYFINAFRKYAYNKNEEVFVFDRHIMAQMIFNSKNISPKMHNTLNECEKRVVGDLYAQYQNECRVIVKSSTTRKNYGAIYGVRSLCLVFDAPIEQQIDRGAGDPYFGDMMEEDVELILLKQRGRMVWPKFNEGWDDIIYVNTCGSLGASLFDDVRVRES